MDAESKTVLNLNKLNVNSIDAINTQVENEINDINEIESLLQKIYSTILPVSLHKGRRNTTQEHRKFIEDLQLKLETVRTNLVKNKYNDNSIIPFIIEILEKNNYNFDNSFDLKKIQEIILEYTSSLEQKRSFIQQKLQLNNLTVYKSNYLIEGSYLFNVTTHKILSLALSKLRNQFRSEQSDYFRKNMVYIHYQELVNVFNMKASNAHNALKAFINELKLYEVLVLFHSNGLPVGPITGQLYENSEGITISSRRAPQTMFKLNGLIGISFTDDFLEYVSKLEDNFTKYKLQEINEIKSKYTLRLFEIIKKNKGLFRFTIELQNLYYMFGYPLNTEFKHFNARVLKPSINEINLITEIDFHVEMELIKVGRTVTSVYFSVRSKDTPHASAEIQKILKELKSQTA